MNDQVTESAQVVSSFVAPSTGAGAVSGQATSPDQGTDWKAEFENLRREVRGLQSRQDKTAAKVEERFKVLQDYAALTGLTIDPAVVERMQVRELLERQSINASSQPASVGEVGTPSTSVDYLAIYNAVGVDPNSNAVIELTAKHANNPEKLSAALVQHKIEKARTQPPATASALIAPTGTTGGDKNQILTQKMSELRTIAGMNGPRDMARVVQLQKEIAELSR